MAHPSPCSIASSCPLLCNLPDAPQARGREACSISADPPTGPWGNGSPTDSGSVSPGSNPGGPASRTRAHPNLVFASDTPARGNVKLRRMSEERSLHEEVRSAWNELAPFWDERMEAGA